MQNTNGASIVVGHLFGFLLLSKAVERVAAVIFHSREISDELNYDQEVGKESAFVVSLQLPEFPPPSPLPQMPSKSETPGIAGIWQRPVQLGGLVGAKDSAGPRSLAAEWCLCGRQSCSAAGQRQGWGI